MEKATMVLINSLGMPIVRHIWLSRTEVSKKGFVQKLSVWYKIKGERKNRGTKFDLSDITIAKGWQEVKGAFNTSEAGEFLSFDSSSLDNMTNRLTNIISFEKETLCISKN